MGNDGIVCDNRIISKTEDVLTPKELKSRWLFGVPIVDNEGNELPDEVLQQYIDIATSYIEHELDISIVPQRCIYEHKDYFANDYWEWGFFQLNNIPVISIEKLQVVYLQNPPGMSNDSNVVLDIPEEWVRLRNHDGMIRLIPNNKFPASLQIGAAGSFFPELFRRHSNVPHLWRFEYTSGFAPGKIPLVVNQAIGLLASVYALNIAGDLVIGAGIAAQSLSLDGLSQTIQTTASATNHAYSAKVLEYRKKLYGEGINSPDRGLMRVLKDYYQGSRINII